MLIKARSRAFTLIETVIAVAIIGIVMLAGLPLFKSWSQNMQIRASSEAVLNGLQFARAEALRRNTTVRFELMTTADNSCAVSTGQTSYVVNLGTSTTNDPSGACGATVSPTVNTDSIVKGVGAPYLLQTYSAVSTGSVNVASTGTATNMLVVFNQYGQLQYPTVDTTWVFSNPSAGACATSSASGAICMNVVVSANGRIRMCNPILAAGSPQGC